MQEHIFNDRSKIDCGASRSLFYEQYPHISHRLGCLSGIAQNPLKSNAESLSVSGLSSKMANSGLRIRKNGCQRLTDLMDNRRGKICSPAAMLVSAKVSQQGFK
jgi:hypothetical protein